MGYGRKLPLVYQSIYKKQAQIKEKIAQNSKKKIRKTTWQV